MNLIPRRLRHGILRMLGVVSPSGAYPLPPRWAMSRKGKNLYYPRVVAAAADPLLSARALMAVAADNADTGPLTGGPSAPSTGGYRSISSQPLCVSATCLLCADTRDAVNGRERGSDRG